MIPLKTHNALDYILGVLFILTPALFEFTDVVFARDVFFVVGFTLVGYSLLTDYLYSFAKIIPWRMHVTFDVVSGVFLILAPFIYGYREELTGFQNALHYAYGVGAIALAVLTRREGAVFTQKRSEKEQPPYQKAA